MLILRIRQAECALADGRLDEAYDLASQEDVREHRRGQKLIGHLVDRLVKRGSDHLDAERPSQAMADCDKAARLGGNQTAVAQLRAAAVAQTMERQRQKHRHDRRLARAGRNMDRGRLSMCENLLHGIAEMDDDAESMLDDVAQRRTEAQAALTGARQALERGDFEAVIAALLDARRAKLTDPKLAELNTDLTNVIVQRVRKEIVRGRLDLAEAMLDRFSLLSNESLDVAELDRVLDLCHTARLRIQSGQMQEARQSLEQLGRIIPDAKWVGQAKEHAQKATTARDALCAGPLELLAPMSSSDSSQPDSAGPVLQERARHETPCPSGNAGCGSALPERFLLQVDGVGCFLVVSNAAVTVGSVSSSRQCDVGLIAQANLPVAMIERLDDDYFVRSDGSVRVNGKTATSRLLAHGDRIELSPRCTMKYHLPNAASTSAMLDLTGVKLPRADVRKVILLDNTIVVGPGSAAHVRADELVKPIVLHLRNGCLHCADDAMEIGKPIRTGPLSMVITKV